MLSLLVLGVPAILLCLTIHEFAHGWVARRLGDPTAEISGRLTLNPIPHLDPIGTVLLIVTMLSGRGAFGWAKPVPVDPRNFNHPKKDMMMVAFAGPASNLLAAVLFGIVYRWLDQSGVYFSFSEELKTFLVVIVKVNVGLAFFNLLPIPPLDGFNILVGVLPNLVLQRYDWIISKLPMIFLFLIALQFMGIGAFWSVLNPLYIPFKNVFQFIVFQRIIF